MLVSFESILQHATESLYGVLQAALHGTAASGTATRRASATVTSSWSCQPDGQPARVDQPGPGKVRRGGRGGQARAGSQLAASLAFSEENFCLEDDSEDAWCGEGRGEQRALRVFRGVRSNRTSQEQARQGRVEHLTSDARFEEQCAAWQTAKQLYCLV